VIAAGRRLRVAASALDPKLLALLALVVATTLTPLTDGDLWWHLAAGREMCATRAFLRVDPFTISAAGRPWPDVHWLFQLAVWGLWNLGGLTAIVIAKIAVVAAGAALLFSALREGSARYLCALLLASGLFVARHLVLVRPVVVTLLLLAAFFLVLERERALPLLPALQIVWVNTQGLFLLGPALIAAYAIGAALERRPSRRLFGTLAFTLLACLCTPYGRFGLTLPGKLLARLRPGADNVFSSNIAENVPPFALPPGAPGAFAPLAVALLLTALSFVVAGRKLRPAHVLVALGFAALALMANRNVLLFYWMAAPIVALNLAVALAPRFAHTPVRLPRVALAALFLGLGALVAVARADETSFRVPAPFRVPAAAVDQMARARRVFTADHYAGYVSFRLYPKARPYLDTRLVLHTADEYADFLGLLDHPARFAEFQRRQRFDHVLLPAAFPDRYLGLIQALADAPDWRLIYTDGTAVLFAATPTDAPALDLDAPATIAAILADLEPRLPLATAAGQAARRHLARLLLLTDHGSRALEVLATLPEDDADALALRARVHLLAGDPAAAETAAQALLTLRPETPAALDLLATVALARGDQAAAIGFLRRSLAADPFGPEARALLARFEAQQRRTRRLETAKP
jgi:hypothetical protein